MGLSAGLVKITYTIIRKCHAQRLKFCGAAFAESRLSHS
jgi:hypothetical protein